MLKFYKVATAAVATFAALSCVSCSTTEAVSKNKVDRDSVYTSPSTDSPRDDAAPEGDSRDLVDPFEEFFLTDEQEKIVTQASDMITAECMAELGFEFQPTNEAGESGGADSVFDPEWGPLDLDSAQEFGYSNPNILKFDESGELTGPGSMNIVESTPELKAYTDALAGTGPDDIGCSGKAYSAIAEDASEPSEADWSEYDRLRRDAYERAMTDASIASVVDAWAECMGDKGYNYSRPSEAITDTWDVSVGADERETAIADVECKESSNLLGVWNNTLHKSQQDVVSQNRPFLDKLHDFQMARLSGAQEVLARRDR